mgnify:CR=1 FL=1
MSEDTGTKVFRSLTDEEVLALSFEDTLAYSKAATEHAQGLAARVAAAKEKHTEAGRQALQTSLQDGLYFPVLTGETLKALAAAGASKFSVHYVLEGEDTGKGLVSISYPAAAAKTAKKGVKKVAVEGEKAIVVQRPVSADWEANTTPEERLEDEAESALKVSAAIAEGRYNGSAAKARGAIFLYVQLRRLAKNKVAGYPR